MKTEIEMAVVPECKIVADAPTARKLLKDGFRIADIKPKRGRPNESVFLFEVVPGFMEKVMEYREQKHEKRNKNHEGEDR